MTPCTCGHSREAHGGHDCVRLYLYVNGYCAFCDCPSFTMAQPTECIDPAHYYPKGTKYVGERCFCGRFAVPEGEGLVRPDAKL